MAKVSVDQVWEANATMPSLARRGFYITRDERNGGAVEYEIRRESGDATVTLRISLFDWQAPTSNVVILTMTTLPESERSKGHGGAAIVDLFSWAEENGIDREIRAVQVSDPHAQRFWSRMGFSPVAGSFTGDWIRARNPPTAIRSLGDAEETPA